jgi:protein-L-isoaspartate(D-aspartate) O-methyltransferase
MVFAKLLQATGIGATDRVLDVGCATGYSAGVLAKLAGDVVALEEDAAMARVAGETLAQIDAKNLSVVSGALAAGWAERAPYDVIVLEGAAEVVPDSLLSQLKIGGRLVAVVGLGPMGKATLYRRAGARATAQPVFDAAAPPCRASQSLQPSCFSAASQRQRRRRGRIAPATVAPKRQCPAFIATQPRRGFVPPTASL